MGRHGEDPTPADRGVLVEELEYAHPSGEFRLVVPRLAVASGEVVAVVGPSGSGKTTLLDLIAGIRLPARGRVIADGFDWAAHGEAARRARRLTHVGLVFQEFELIDALSVRENIALPGELAQGRDDLRERVESLARAVGIEARLDRRPRQLSQGERQRVALCRALVVEPPLLLADEPTGNLDTVAGDAALGLLVEQARSHGVTLMVVTHDRSTLGRFDRVVELPMAAAGASR